MAVVDYFQQNNVSRDLLDLVRGKQLGKGISREVYEFGPDTNYVIKFELGQRSFQNVMEWTTWNDYKDAPAVAKWLAPCKMISDCGAILLQRRTELIRRSELPEKVPTWATDTKIGNWGLVDGNPVMHDYGLTCAQLPNRLKKAEWWGFSRE